MEIENAILQAANKFEKVRIKNKMLKIGYFGIRSAVSVWILSIFLVIGCQMFQNINFRKNLIENIKQWIVKKQDLFLLSVLVLIFTSILNLVFIIKVQRQIPLKISLISFLFLENFVTFISTFLLIIFFTDQVKILLKIFSVLLFIIMQLYSIIYDKFFITFSFQSQNDFSHTKNSYITFINIIQKSFYYIALCGILFYSRDWVVLQIYYPVLFKLNLFKLIKLFYQQYYINQQSNNLQIWSSICSLVLLLLIIIYDFFQIQLLMKNAFQGWVIVSIFAIFSTYLYLNSKKNSYYFKSLDQVIQKKQIINYLQAFYLLWSNSESVYNSLIVASIKKNHQYKCKSNKCFCKQAKIVQQTNNSVLDGNQVFFKGYFIENLQYIEKQNKKLDDIYLRILHFKFRIFNNYIHISRQLHKLDDSKGKSIETKVGKYILQYKINSYLRSMNHRHDSLNIQQPMILNSVLEQLKKIIYFDIHVKNKKWNNLSKDLCKSYQIEQQIEKEIQNLRNIDMIYQQNKIKYQKSIGFNALCMFYFGDICCLNKYLEAIQSNLRDLKTIIKYHQIVNNKEMAKNIFDGRCSLIECNLSQVQMLKNVDLSISNCTDNVKLTFKYEKSQLIQQKIQILFPKFLWPNQKNQFIEFLNEEENEKNSQVSDKYYVDRFGNVFQGLTSMKMIPKAKGISLMILIFQKDTKNIVLLNSKGMIENVGQTYRNYFGKIYQQLPISSFFYFDDEYESMKFNEKPMKNKFILIDGAQLGSDWLTYLQQIKHFIKRKSSSQKYKMKQTQSTLKNSIQSKNKENSQLKQFLRKQKRQLIRSKILTGCTLKNIKDTNKFMNQKTHISILSASLNYKMCSYKNFEFFVIVFDQIKRKRSLNAQTQYTIKSLKQIKQRNTNYQGTLTKIEGKQQDQQKILLENLQNQEEAVNSIDIEEELRKKQRQQQLIYHQASSVQSSLNTGSVSYFYYKFIQICFDLFKNPSNITDKRLNIFTSSSLFMSALISALVIVTYIIFNAGLYQVKDIFFADGAVSDNMQLTQFMYNRAMNFKQFKNDSIQLQKIMKSAYYERQYLFGLTVFDLGQYLNEQTSMTKTKFYQYITIPITWRFTGQDTTSLEIQTNQLLNYYYELSRQVQLNILNDSKEGKATVKNALQLMRINFPELKRINHWNLFLYQKMSDNSLYLLRNLIIVLGLIHGFLSFITFLIYYKQKIFRRNQLMQGFSIYKLIPQKILEIVSIYYDNYCKVIKTEKQLINYESHYDRTFLYLPNDQSLFIKPNRNKFIVTHSFFTPSIWKLLFIVLLLNFAFIFMLIKIKNLFDPIEKMMINVNNLMDSQNYLLESYLDLKAKFIIEENYNVTSDFFDQLLESHLNTDVLFNKISVQSLELFSNYDQSYKTQFIDLLINNVCEIVKKQVDSYQYQICKNNFKLKMLDNGVLTAMNFFTRRIRELINQFKEKFSIDKNHNVNLANKTYINQVLKSSDFREIDESIIFMFKMYQGTQARIYESLEVTIIDIMNFSLWVVALEVVILALVYPTFLYLNFKAEKFELSQLYVSFLLIPSPLAKHLKTFAGKIQKILQYQKVK